MKKCEINAAILEKTYAGIVAKIKSSRGIVDIMQIDVCDGKFVPSKTFGSAGCEASFKRIATLTKRDTLELDMMIDWDVSIIGRFDKWLRAINAAKPDRVVLHYTSTTQWDEIFEYFKKSKIEFGLGVHLHHKNKDILDMLDKYPFKYVQVMGIEKVGFGGQGFSTKTYTKVHALKKALPRLVVSIDGSVKVTNAGMLKEAGASRLASGSGIFKYEEGIACAVELMRKAKV